MGHLNEIIASGRAPGVNLGRGCEPGTMYEKIPKALREIENQPRYKHGPPIGAKHMAKYMGLSVDKIKKVWDGKGPLIAGLLLLCFTARAGQLVTGESFTDGQTVHASDLNNAINNATIQPVYIYGQPINNNPLLSDYLIEYSPTLNATYKVTLSTVQNNPSSIIQLPNGTPSYTTNDLFSFYSAANTNLETINFSNFVNLIVSFWPSTLQQWPGGFAGQSTNNQPFFAVFGTNGVPYKQSLSNIETAVAGDLGTNLFIPYEFAFAFAPWTIYNTNPAGTNLWGYPTNFPITSIVTGTYPTNTLIDSDTVPVYEKNQGTNTSMTLFALRQYMITNNALPPYTFARAQFAGAIQTLTISNDADTVNNLISVTANAFISLTNFAYPFTISTNQSQAMWTGIQTNTIYYFIPQASNNVWGHVYANYAAAQTAIAAGAAPTGFLTISATGTGGYTNRMCYLTNYTSFNADVVPTETGTNTLLTGQYDLWFRTPAATNVYYMTGSLISGGDSSADILMLSQALQTTNAVRVRTTDLTTAYVAPPRVEVQITPQ